MAGSSPLNPEQQGWYVDRFGVRYLAVQESPGRPSRRVRRSRKVRDEQEMMLVRRQLQAQKAMR